MVPGTILLFDEYYNYPQYEDHEHKAFMEFVERRNLKYKFIAFNGQGKQAAV
jgi:hypothetical protein